MAHSRSNRTRTARTRSGRNHDHRRPPRGGPDRVSITAALSAVLVDAGLDLPPLLRLAAAIGAMVLTLGGRLIEAGPLSLHAGRYRCAGGRGVSVSVVRHRRPVRHLGVGVQLGGRGFGVAAALGPLPPGTDLPVLLGSVRRRPPSGRRPSRTDAPATPATPDVPDTPGPRPERPAGARRPAAPSDEGESDR
ncbi:hypothetical protein [Kitasatospora sp. NPDC086791]|uniref:hypothetical protein n=1 Tax=Kitasatospora sp. NPDC086791 TaxID=3155178 RepID=UPI003437F225